MIDREAPERCEHGVDTLLFDCEECAEDEFDPDDRGYSRSDLLFGGNW